MKTIKYEQYRGNIHYYARVVDGRRISLISKDNVHEVIQEFNTLQGEIEKCYNEISDMEETIRKLVEKHKRCNNG